MYSLLTYSNIFVHNNLKTLHVFVFVEDQARMGGFIYNLTGHRSKFLVIEIKIWYFMGDTPVFIIGMLKKMLYLNMFQ